MTAASPSLDSETLRRMALAIRFLAADAVQAANSGHPGMPMGMADVASVLFSKFLKFDPSAPDWADRDRFVLSAGHGSMLLYALLHLTGYADMTLDQLKAFRQLGSKTAGHPEYGHAQGIETTTGPLGQGIATAVGMAIAERHLAARFGVDLVDHRTWVLAGDGCLMEGISHEAIGLAGHLGLDRLIVLWDDNQISIDGPTDLSTSEDERARFEAAGWWTTAVDGHDADAVAKALEAATKAGKPALVACRTVIGWGAPTLAGTAKTHGAPLGGEEIATMREALSWSHGPFEIPEDVRAAWRSLAAPGAAARAAWRARLEDAGARGQALVAALSGDIGQTAREALAAHRIAMAATKPKVATRKASQDVLEAVVPACPQLMGGSADLTGSNLTRTKGMVPFTKDDHAGQYLFYGIREHGMAAAMNGMALHGGVIPYGGTFLVFTDYLRPSLRLSALMAQRVIYVMTHDSIGLGEDGPTHQPIEHLASLRAMPNVLVLRPADAVETAECWEIALDNTTGPSVLALSRQGCPPLREDATANRSREGGYVLADAEGPRAVTLVATGSEVGLAMDVRAALAAGQGIAAAVVSMPSQELFLRQPKDLRQKVLGTVPVVSIEAACTFGWERIVGAGGLAIGIDSFGASAPAKDAYAHFGLTVDAISARVADHLKAVS